MDPESIKKRIEEKFGPPRRTGGKGSLRTFTRRKHVEVDPSQKKLNNLLEKNRINNKLDGIQSVSIIKTDGTVIRFETPEVKSAMQSSVVAVTGKSESKSVNEFLPDIYEKLDDFMKISLKDKMDKIKKEKQDNDDEMPEMVIDFEKVSLENMDPGEEIDAEKVEENNKEAAEEEKNQPDSIGEKTPDGTVETEKALQKSE